MMSQWKILISQSGIVTRTGFNDTVGYCDTTIERYVITMQNCNAPLWRRLNSEALQCHQGELLYPNIEFLYHRGEF